MPWSPLQTARVMPESAWRRHRRRAPIIGPRGCGRDEIMRHRQDEVGRVQVRPTQRRPTQGRQGRQGSAAWVQGPRRWRFAILSCALLAAFTAATPHAADTPTPVGKSPPSGRAAKQSVANERASTDAGERSSGSIAVYNCEGRNSETYARVYGTCQNGTFSGPNDTTGNIAYGTCVPGGAFEATDTATAQKATGRCDASPRRAVAPAANTAR